MGAIVALGGSNGLGRALTQEAFLEFIDFKLVIGIALILQSSQVTNLTRLAAVNWLLLLVICN